MLETLVVRRATNTLLAIIGTSGSLLADPGVGSFLPTRVDRPNKRQNATQILPQAGRIWRADAVRERRKENAYWSRFRKDEEGKLLASYRAVTESAIRAAHARTIRAAQIKLGGKNGQMSAPLGDSLQLSADRSNSSDRSNQSAVGALARAAEQKFQAARRTVGSAATNLAGAMEQSFVTQKSSSGPSGASVILALVVIFLVPGCVGLLATLAFLSLRGGHRLQGAVFATAGLLLSLLIYKSLYHAPNAGKDGMLQARCLE